MLTRQSTFPRFRVSIAPAIALAVALAALLLASSFMLAARSTTQNAGAASSAAILGTIRTENIVVDNAMSVGGDISACVNVLGGCIGKPRFTFDPQLGETNIEAEGVTDNVFRSLHNILKDMSGATASQQLVQSIISGTVDTTAGDINVWAGEYGVQVTKSAGGNALRNIAILIHATGGDENLAIESTAGDWFQNDAASSIINNGELHSHSFEILNSNPGTVDFTNATSVTLGNQVQPFQIPGTTSLNPTISLGGAAGNGEQLIIKNTVTGAFGSLNGVGIGLDTTVDAGARGGIIIHRGAGGNFGGSDAKALWVSSGGDVSSQAAGDLVVFQQETGKSIWFVTGGTGTNRTPLVLKAPSSHWLADGPTVVPSSCGTGPTIAGPDTSFRISSGVSGTGTCTLTFANTYTSVPSCVVFPEGGAAIPTCTISATAITCSAGIVDATTYNWHCIGTSSGGT